MELLASLQLYFKCFFHRLFGKSGPYSIAFESLVQFHSYRLTKGAQKDLLIGLRYFRKALIIIWCKKDKTILWDPKSSYALYDSRFFFENYRKSYTETITKNTVGLFLSKDHLGLHKNVLSKCFETALMSSFFLMLTPFILFRKNRGSIALNLLETLECARLIEHLKRNNIKYLYYYSPFNKDANYTALRLHAQGIICHKVSSSNPLSNFYSKVVSDKFSFSCPFHHKEYERLKSNWYVGEIDEWPTYRFQVIHPMLSDYQTPPKNSLGFISSGIWRRREIDHLSVGGGDQESELHLIDYLKNFLRVRPEIEFYIFLHPIEKKTDELYGRAKQHYMDVFEGVKVNFFEKDTHTFLAFDKVDTSIAAYSSTNLERLYAGFKTLYAPLGIREDYYSYSEINNIAAFQENQLDELILNTLKQGTEEFFESNNLWEYHHRRFAYLFESTS